MTTPQGDVAPSSKMSGFVVPPRAPSVEPPTVQPVAPVVEAHPTFLRTTTDLDDLAKRAEEAMPPMPEEPLDPALTYGDRLKRVKLTLEQAFVIIDALTIEGVYREDVQITKRVKATFVSRSTRFNSYLADSIDIADPKKVGKLQQMMAVYQIAASLDKYGDKVMPKFNDDMAPEEWVKALSERVKLVERLPGAVFTALSMKVAEFDAKMFVVFSEGYEENF